MFLPKKTRVEYALEIPDKGFENIIAGDKL